MSGSLSAPRGVSVARRLSWAALVLGLLAVGVSLWRMASFQDGLARMEAHVDETPVTVLSQADASPGPVVVIAHGFAGSRQLMQPFAVSLARAGYVAVSLDFAGHGRSTAPMRGDLDRIAGVTRQLVGELTAVAAWARALPESDGRLAFLGHSMASDLVIRAGQETPETAAVVAVSLFSPALDEAAGPANLLAISGEYEATLREQGLKAVTLGAGASAPEEGRTYGDFADGSARRAVSAQGVEHVGVLFSATTLSETRAWLDRAFGRQSNDAPLALYGPWIGIWLLGLVIAAGPLIAQAPTLAKPRLGAQARLRDLLLIALPPAALTPLLLWPTPTAFLPMLVGDYLAAHFALFGLLMGLLFWRLARKGGGLAQPTLTAPGPTAFTAAALMAGAGLLLFWPIDLFVTSFVPTGDRALLFLVVLAGALPFFLVDEWITRGGSPGAYALTKFVFLLSLGLAVALDFERLFFLIMILPVILLFFILFGLVSWLSWRRTGSPWPAALANSAAFAWSIACVFPLFQS